MRFKYSARNTQGELQAGFVDAATKDSAFNILQEHNLFVLVLEEAEKISWYIKFFGFFGRPSLKDIMLFTRQFSVLLEAKVPLSDGLRALETQTIQPVLRGAIGEIRNSVSAGLALSQALEQQSEIFSNFYINIVRPAEVTGRLDQSMSFLADYLEKEVMWLSRIRNALIYPIIVIILFLVVAGVMLVFVFPQLEPIFKEANLPLPFITQAFLGIGNFIINWWLAVILVGVLVIVLIADYLRSREGRLVLDEVKTRLPIFGNLFKKIYVARFAEAVSILIKGGIPLTQGIEIAGHAMDNVVYAEVIHEIAEGVKRGDTFSAMLTVNEHLFPILIGEMVAIGESTGRMDEVLSRVSYYYTREVNDVLDNLVELIQPILIVFIGTFVGLLFASILIPIYNLIKVI